MTTASVENPLKKALNAHKLNEKLNEKYTYTFIPDNRPKVQVPITLSNFVFIKDAVSKDRSDHKYMFTCTIQFNSNGTVITEDTKYLICSPKGSASYPSLGIVSEKYGLMELSSDQIELFNTGLAPVLDNLARSKIIGGRRSKRTRHRKGKKPVASRKKRR
jgi:hypothetical protein